jgi:murein DD-endopeptidase MepM/ murein hydrolase activator NlpD
MNQTGHYFYLINPRSISRVRRIKLTGFVASVVVCFLLAGVIGLGRLAWFATTYTEAKIGFYREQRENDHFLLKISLLDKFLRNETEKFKNLVAFEDSARLEYGMDPVSADVREAGIGGPALALNRKSVVMATPLILKAAEVQENLSALLRKVQLQNSTFSQMGEEVERLHKSWEQRPSIMPVTGDLTSSFGYRPDPVTGEIAFHDGYDIANEIGTPVYAAADGIVKATGYMQNYGISVVLSHPRNGLETIYAHLSNYAVCPDKQVKRGDLIGSLGNSGKSTGPHLHYEIRQNDRPVNPRSYILPTDQIVD